MPSPFPGVDPFIEASGLWPDFHSTFIATWRDAIMSLLPDNYVARIEERPSISEREEPRARNLRPDISVSRVSGPASPGSGSTPRGATLEPEIIAVQLEDEIRETFIEIYRVSDERLVSVLELLSPSNKDARDRSQYLAKRNAVLRQEIHLVELDLLLDGARLPMRQPLPPAHYYAIVSRWERRPDCEVYHWRLADPLPGLPIPLAAPDGDVQVDLAEVFATTFARGRYERSIKYRQTPTLPFTPTELNWIEQIAGR